MANRDAPRGFRPVRHLTGGQIRPEVITIAAANTIIGTGDVLVQTVAGVYDRGAGGDIIGAVAAQPAAAAQGGTILAYIDPQIVYVSQTDDGTGTGTIQDALTLNFDYVAGDAANDQSIFELDEDSAAVTATLPWKAVGLHKAVDNALGEFNKLEVIPNNAQIKGTTGALGV